MKKKHLWILYAAYAGVVVGLSLWQLHRYRASFETVQPYSHPGAVAERTFLPDEEEETETAAEKATRPRSASSAETEHISETTKTVTEPEPTETDIVFPIDINTADAFALEQIPGIGEVTAAAIIAYRDEHGGFRNREELMQIHGIGEKRYQELLGYIYLTDEQPLPVEETESVQPLRKESPPETPEPEPEPPELPVINLNTADKDRLMLLPGCTEALAEELLNLRDEQLHGFSSTLEITLTESMTMALYYAWEPYLAVDDEGHAFLEEPEP